MIDDERVPTHQEAPPQFIESSSTSVHLAGAYLNCDYAYSLSLLAHVKSTFCPQTRGGRGGGGFHRNPEL